MLRGGLCAKDAFAPLYVVEVDFKDAAFAQQVAVLSGSGGGGAVASDLVGEAGLQAATLGATTVHKLLPLMPEAAAHLPFDLGAVPGPMGGIVLVRKAIKKA